MLDSKSKAEINDKVTEITGRTIAQMRAAANGVGLPGSKIKAKFRKKEALINRISFTIPKALIFREKGAGKGKAGNKGSQWKNKEGQTIKTNPKALAK